MRKRSILLLLIPVLIFLWTICWIFLYYGEKTGEKPVPTKKDNIQMTVQLPQTEEIPA
jgi:flagellar basal body-associated protein FliL